MVVSLLCVLPEAGHTGLRQGPSALEGTRAAQAFPALATGAQPLLCLALSPQAVVMGHTYSHWVLGKPGCGGASEQQPAVPTLGTEQKPTARSCRLRPASTSFIGALLCVDISVPAPEAPMGWRKGRVESIGVWRSPVSPLLHGECSPLWWAMATVAMGCEEVSGEKPSGWGLVQGSGWLKARWL